MGPPVIVELDPGPDGPGRMLLCLEALPVHALLLQTSAQTLLHPVLLWGVRGDELLFEAVGPHQFCVMTTREDEAIVRS